MTGAAASLLTRLLERRLEPGADLERIDRQITDAFEETWSVVFSDLEGFSRTVDAFGIVHFLTLIHRQRRQLGPIVLDHGGLILKEEADSWLLLFPRPLQAVQAMSDCLDRCDELNRDQSPENQLRMGCGVGYGPVLRIGDEDVWGREVNYASKLGEELARHGDILLTRRAGEELQGQGAWSLEPRRERLGSLDLELYRALRPPATRSPE